MASSEYQSPYSVAKRQTLYIDANDPRVRGFMANLTAAKSGAEIVIIGDKSLYGLGVLSYLKNSGQQDNSKGFDPKKPNFIKPGTVSNLSAAWQIINNKDVLAITWDFNTTLPENRYVTGFSLKFVKTSNSTTYYTKSEDLNTSSINQKYDMTPEKNGAIFGPIKLQ